MQVIVYPDADTLADAAARFIAEAVNTGQEGFSLGLAGGSTPIETYDRLSRLDVAWERVEAWMSDERWVPLDDPECNGNQAARELMDHVPARFHRPQFAAWLTAADSAAHYEAVLRSLHPSGRSDLILLGMGEDGHCASLFPGTAALDSPSGRWFVHNYVPQLDAERLTTTYEFLHAAHAVAFLVAGTAKAEALRAVLEPRPDESVLPSTRVMDGESEVTWLIDKAAAAELADTDLVEMG